MSKAFRYHQHGGPEVLRFEDVEVGKPGPGQVRIRNKAVAVNYRDVLMRKGIHAMKSFPAGIGLESAGVIDAVGPEVEGFAVGDRVAYAGMPEGSYAEERIVPVTRLLALPDGIDERTAASMMIRGMTARTLLHRRLQGAAGRHHPDPRRRRRGRPDRVPMGEASRRHRDRHRVERREGRGRPRPRLRPCDRLHARGFSRARARDHRRRRRAGGLRFRSARRPSRDR